MKKNLVIVLSQVVLMFATISANFGCDILFHQEKQPDSVKKLRKF